MTDVHTLQERAGDRAAGRALERHRESVSQALAARPGFDIADLSDEEFEGALARERKRQERIRQIIKNDLIKGEDYGEVSGIPQPFAWEGAADKIALRFRWTCQPIGDPSITRGEDYLAATVTVGVFDSMGRLVHSVPRSCSTMERRFKNSKTKKWKFDDPAEALNEVVAMAFKRGKVAGVLSAAAAKRYFANPEQLNQDDEPDPWTPEQKQVAYALAPKAGIKTPEDFAAFVQETLGREAVYAVDVPKLMEKLEEKVEARKQAKAQAKATGSKSDAGPEQDLKDDAALAE